MDLDRRDFLCLTGLALASPVALDGRSSPGTQGPTIGMCEWNIGRSCDPQMIARAAEVGVTGIQIDVAIDPAATSVENVCVRDPAVIRQYLELAKQHGITIHSVAPAYILFNASLKTEPVGALYVLDAVEAAVAVGASTVMVPFFRGSDLRLRDSAGQLRSLRAGPFSVYETYEVDAPGVARVVELLRHIMPRVEAAGLVLGLETTLTAEQTLDIIDRIGSPHVQVYYDVGNSTNNGYDVPSEIRMLGRERICEMHLKDPKSRLLGEGIIDFQTIADACRDIGYDKWYVLETSGREGHFLEDTRANVAFVQRTFA